MQSIGALLGGSFVLASLIVGIRLIRLSLSTRRSPELRIGAGLMLLAVFGYPLMVVARKAEALSDPSRAAIAFAAACALAVGGWLIVSFVRCVFRPDAGLASLVVWTYGAAAAGLLAWQTLGDGWWAWVSLQQGPWAAMRWLTLVPICWGGVESLRYWTLMRRRLALGLADPVLTDRFRLFGAAMLGGFVANSGTVVCQVMGVEVVGTSIGALIVSPAGLAAVSLWLAFLPPAAYTRRLSRRASQAARPAA